MQRLGSETLTVLRAPLVAAPRDGTQYRDWTAPTSTVVVGCMVEPYLMSNKLVKEDDESREWSQEYLRCWVPEDADIVYTDRVQWRGDTYEVFGPAQLWVTRRGVRHHKQLNLMKRAG